MSLLLGVRLALAGGRESVARMVLMTIGVAVGMVLLLLSLTGLPARQSHIDRLAWHRTTAQSPPTAEDGAWWLAVTDRYAGTDVIRVNVAALGPRPPVPPGVERLPGPGEVVVSPALAELLRSVPDDQLRDRFPGRIVGTIGDEGLLGPSELVGIVGRTPEEMEIAHGAYEIRGVERPGERLDLYELVGILHGIIAMLVIGPVMVFVWVATRIGGMRREQRFAAIRLAGASRLQTAALATVETGGATTVGIVLGWLGYQAARPIVASRLTFGHSAHIFTQDLVAPTWQVVASMSAVLVLAVSTTLVALRPAQITPLGVHQRVPRRPPGLLRLAPLAIGILGLWVSSMAGQDETNPITSFLISLVGLFSPVALLMGIALSGSLVCLWISRGLARLSGGAATVIVARRIAVDPYSTFRAVSGAAVAMFVATMLGMLTANDRIVSPTAVEGRSVLDQGVVAVHVQGAPEETLAPLLRNDGVVIARLGTGRRIVVACAELIRVTNLECPLPASLGDGDDINDRLKSEQLFALPTFDATSADNIFRPTGFVEPGPDAARMPIQTLFVPTDGTPAGQERIRTLAAATVPVSRSKTSQDLPPPLLLGAPAVDAVLPYAMVFVMLVAAASLTLSVINGIMERRRPFALLRASGVRLGQLRRFVLLETGIPLVVTVFGGVGLAMLLTRVMLPPELWAMPEPTFFIGLAASTLLAFAVSLIALPLMNFATRHDSIRFE